MANTKLRITELCKEKGTTVAKLAEHLGIKPSSLSQAIWQNSFSEKRLSEIADFLGVTIPELYEDYKLSLNKEFAKLFSGTWENGEHRMTINIE